MEEGRKLVLVGVFQEAMAEDLACPRIFFSMAPSDGGQKRYRRLTVVRRKNIYWRIVDGDGKFGNGVSNAGIYVVGRRKFVNIFVVDGSGFIGGNVVGR